MAPFTFTAEFTQAVDNLIQDSSVLDTALHSRARQYLEVFNESNPVQVQHGPAWAERIYRASPHLPLFTSLGLFNAMYLIADELGLGAGKRYVSAAICACGEHAIHHAGDAQAGQAAGLARALHDLSSTWVAFVLWPFYAFANRDTTYSWLEDLPDYGSAADYAARMEAKDQRRRCEEQVKVRDGYRCFMTGFYNSRSRRHGPFPQDAQFLSCCIASIIPSEVWAHEDAHSQDILFSMLERFCDVDRTALIKKATQGPQNTLFTYISVADGFERFLWSLHPTEKANHYEIKTYRSSADEGCRHTTSHVTFVDHSVTNASVSPSAPDHSVTNVPGGGVDLPDRELLRVHAALAGMLDHSGVGDAFVLLRYRSIHIPEVRFSAYPEPSGGAFWKSVVEYEGPEVCLEVELGEDGSDTESELSASTALPPSTAASCTPER